MDSCWSHKKDYDDLRSDCSLDMDYGDDRANIDDFCYGRLNISGPKGSYGALLIRTLVFGLSGGILTIIIMMVIMVILTLYIVVMIIVVVLITIIAMMSDIPMGPSMVRNSASQKVICII